MKKRSLDFLHICGASGISWAHLTATAAVKNTLVSNNIKRVNMGFPFRLSSISAQFLVRCRFKTVWESSFKENFLTNSSSALWSTTEDPGKSDNNAASEEGNVLVSCVLNSNNNAVAVCDRQSVWRGQCACVLNSSRHTWQLWRLKQSPVLLFVWWQARQHKLHARPVRSWKTFLILSEQRERERERERSGRLSGEVSTDHHIFPICPQIFPSLMGLWCDDVNSHGQTATSPDLTNQGLTIFCWSSLWQKYWQLRWVLGLYLSFFLQNVFNSFAMPLKRRS